MAPSNSNNQQIIAAALAAAALTSLLCYFYFSTTERETVKQLPAKEKKLASLDNDLDKKAAAPTSSDKTPKTKNAKKEDLTHRIEELDKEGKALFKSKKYMEAAVVFTKALDLIKDQDEAQSTTLFRQNITLLNNRSAMYEKGGQPELALEDCNTILELEVPHTKARTRKLRVLEGMGEHHQALVEVCALQLLFMQQNRESLKRGFPVPSPPVPASKMEDILGKMIPGQVAEQLKKHEGDERPLPSKYTILQLLKSYSDYNSWMSAAAQSGSIDELTKQLSAASSDVEKSNVLLKRGLRHMYHRSYAEAGDDFEAAYKLAAASESVQVEMDSYARLLQWTGMTRHFRYKLDSALDCYVKCADLDPTNAIVLVKQAGVQMDASRHEDALKLFDMALGIDPGAADALLHRSNLRMLQSKPEEAKKDLEACLKLRPNHVMARLRLAAILAATNDVDGAKKQMDRAEQIDPRSSEVQSYRGELYFSTGDMAAAKEQFDKAREMEPTNPTPYVNAAMAVLNTPPPPGQVPDAETVISLLEQAIDVDSQFAAAYVQLGQLKLGTATDLVAARKVIDLYDTALENCRAADEVKELCSMRTLAVAQVEAAQMLRMETFNLQ